MLESAHEGVSGWACSKLCVCTIRTIGKIRLNAMMIFFVSSEKVAISDLLAALIRIMCTSLPTSSEYNGNENCCSCSNRRGRCNQTWFGACLV